MSSNRRNELEREARALKRLASGRAPRVPRVTICCIKTLDEARAAIAEGASALGLGAAMPTGPGVIDEPAIAEVARGVPPPIATFLLTSAVTADEIVDQQRRCGTSTVQLVAGVDPCVHEQLRKRMPGIGLVQVIHVMGAGSLHEALEVSPRVDAILLDSGNPTLAVKELGGTGRVHDWSVSRTIREQVDVPVFLAGGLTVANVGDAIEAVGPFALDLCSGVRTNDELDRAKLGAFMASVRKVEVGSSRSSP